MALDRYPVCAPHYGSAAVIALIICGFSSRTVANDWGPWGQVDPQIAARTLCMPGTAHNGKWQWNTDIKNTSGKPLRVYFTLADNMGNHDSGAWFLQPGEHQVSGNYWSRACGQGDIEITVTRIEYANAQGIGAAVSSSATKHNVATAGTAPIGSSSGAPANARAQSAGPVQQAVPTQGALKFVASCRCGGPNILVKQVLSVPRQEDMQAAATAFCDSHCPDEDTEPASATASAPGTTRSQGSIPGDSPDACFVGTRATSREEFLQQCADERYNKIMQRYTEPCKAQGDEACRQKARKYCESGLAECEAGYAN
jgi:hypothetical protein